MRLTLNIDDRVLAAARARAAAEGVSMGQAVSAFALEGIEGPPRAASAPVAHRIPVLFGPVEGHVLTSELVAAALEDR
jgi:hypothetical protein